MWEDKCEALLGNNAECDKKDKMSRIFIDSYVQLQLKIIRFS